MSHARPHGPVPGGGDTGAATGTRTLFVYFKAAPEHDRLVGEGLARLQAAVLASLPEGSRLARGRRSEPTAGPRTWLESYELPAQADPVAALAARERCAIEAGLGSWIIGEPHVEVFDMTDLGSSRGDLRCA